MTLLESFYQTILTYSELISNSIHTSTELLPNKSKNFLKSLRHLNRQKALKQKILDQKWEKSAYTHETDNFAINFSWVYMIGHWWLYGRTWPSSLPRSPKRILISPNTEGPQEIWNFPSPLASRYKINF